MARGKGARIEALKALSGVVSEEGCPLASRLGGLGMSSAIPAGSGTEPRPKTHFGIFLGHRTLVADRIMRFLPSVMHKLNIFV